MAITKEAALEIIKKWLDSENNRSGEGSPYIDDSMGLKSVLIDGRVNVDALASRIANVSTLADPPIVGVCPECGSGVVEDADSISGGDTEIWWNWKCQNPKCGESFQSSSEFLPSRD